MIQVLQSNDELIRCRHELRELGLDFAEQNRPWLWLRLFSLRYRKRPPIPDVAKSWDVSHALRLIRSHLPDRESPVLDMGCFNSEILYVLHKSGYRRLYGCDLDARLRWMPYWHRIDYRVSDITSTPFADHFFSAITCLSVVEHGVAVPKLILEARRLLKPNGLFLLTTDYDAVSAHEVDPDFRAFGQSWTVFDQNSLQGIVSQFTDAGFSIAESNRIAFDHFERPISWNGHSYTFAMVALRAPRQ